MSLFRSRLNHYLTTVLIASLIFGSLGVPMRVRAATVPPSRPAEDTAATDSLTLSISQGVAQDWTVNPKADEIVESISKCQTGARTSTHDLLSPACVPARTGLQSTAVPTYYLSPAVHEVILSHPSYPNKWAEGCFYEWAEADIVAVVFRTSKVGSCQLKRMGSAEANCSPGSELWGNTSDELIDGGYYCSIDGDTSNEAACAAIAPEATTIRYTGWGSQFRFPPAGEWVNGGFELGWNCSGSAKVYDIRLVYYGIPPNPLD